MRTLKYLIFVILGLLTTVSFFLFSDYSLRDAIILYITLQVIALGFSIMRYVEKEVENSEREE